MMQTRHRILLASVAAAATLIAAACDESTVSFSPTAPSAFGRSPAAAIITGRVSGASGLSPSTATTSTSGMTVRVVGTNVSSSVGRSGQFTLTDVPPGTVRLGFSSAGTDAILMLGGISSGDRIEIVVALDGTNATVQSEVVEMEGGVSGLAGTCPSLTFTVTGRQVRTNSATSFKAGPCSMIQRGSVVEVRGQLQSDGSFRALSVEIEADPDDEDGDDDEDQDDRAMKWRGTVSGLTGTCPVLTFVVNGTTMVTNNSTRFERGCNSVRNGQRVEVVGAVQANGRVLATEVEVDD